MIPWGHSNCSRTSPFPANSFPSLSTKYASPMIFAFMQIQETLLVWASRNPWIQNKLTNKVFFVYDIPKAVKTEHTRFRKKPESPDDLCITDFRRAKLNPLFITKAYNKLGEKLEAPAFSFYFSKPKKQRPQATGPWEPKIREQLRNMVLPQNRFLFWL